MRPVVVALRPPPGQPRVQADELAQPSCLYCILDPPVHRHGPGLEDRARLQPGLPYSIDQPVDLLRHDVRRLLHDQVLARIDRGNRHVHVHPAGRADVHHLDLLVRQHLFVPDVPLHAVPLDHRVQPLLIDVADSDQSSPGRVRNCLRVVLSHSQTDHAEPNVSLRHTPAS